MGIIPVPEPGQCTISQCNSDQSTFINCNTGGCTVCGKSFASNTPIKQLLKGSMAVPWVRLRFEGDNCPPSSIVPTCTKDGLGNALPVNWDYTEITTGNISQPGCVGTTTAPGCTEKCRAVIKSFQYGWGNIQSGNVCKIVIHDESGSTFDSWFWRIARNSLVGNTRAGQSANKMKITFGWIIVGGEGDACPAEVTWANPGCNTGSTRLICSPTMWFLPFNLTTTLQGGKFIYEVEGRDLLMRDQTQPRSETFGGSGPSIGKTHFVDAVVKLGMTGRPPFNVRFLQLDESDGDTPQQLEFHKAANTATGSLGAVTYVDVAGQINSIDYYKNCGSPVIPGVYCAEADTTTDLLKKRGPLGVYRCAQKDSLGAVNNWLTQGVAAASTAFPNGKGITINYDPTYDATNGGTITPQEGLPSKGALLVWANAMSGSIDRNRLYNLRRKGVYIVNGGACSCVYNFTPSIKWHWSALIAGGGMGPTSGEMVAAAVGMIGQGFGATTGGPLVPTQLLASNPMLESGANPLQRTMQATQQHVLANPIHNIVEADLKVQGDPSDWLCTPFNGYGRTVGIIVINPYYLANSTQNNCPDWTQRSVCHDVLTNRNWFVLGAEHTIKEGSYTTNIKVALLDPRDEIPATSKDSGLMGISADPDAAFTQLCEMGTENCAGAIQLGGEDVFNGSGDLVAGICNTNVDGNFNPCKNLNDYVIG